MKTGFVVLLIAALYLAGCAEKEPQASEEAALAALPFKAPEWVDNSALEGKLTAVGSSPQVTGGIRFQQIEAAGRAREKLRKQVEQKAAVAAREVFAALTPEGMTADELEAEAHIAALMVGAQSLKEFRREQIWWSPTREHYVLLSVELTTLRSVMIEGIRLYVRASNGTGERFRTAKESDLIEKAVDRALLAEGTPLAKEGAKPTEG